MDKLFLLHELIKYLLVSHLMLIKMIIMLLVCEIANQIDKSDEMPGNIEAARRSCCDALARHPAPHPPHKRGSPTAPSGRYAALPGRGRADVHRLRQPPPRSPWSRPCSSDCGARLPCPSGPVASSGSHTSCG